MEFWTDRHSHSFWVCPIICVTQTEYLVTAECFKVDRFFFFLQARQIFTSSFSPGGKKRERNKQIVQVCIIIDDILTNFKAECSTQWWLCVREMWPRAAAPARCSSSTAGDRDVWTGFLLVEILVSDMNASPRIKRVLIKSDSVWFSL